MRKYTQYSHLRLGLHQARGRYISCEISSSAIFVTQIPLECMQMQVFFIRMQPPVICIQGNFAPGSVCLGPGSELVKRAPVICELSR